MLPAGGLLQIPVNLSEPVVSWHMTLAWGTLPGGNDLDARLTDSFGRELGRSESLNALSLFGRTEGVHLLGAVPAHLNAEIYFKNPTGVLNQPFEMSVESGVAVLTAYSDLGILSASLIDRATRAVARHVLDGRGDRFDPFDGLGRGELARSLALTAELPQRIASQPSFPDTGLSDPAFPYVETVAGVRAKRTLMLPANGHAFKSGAAVTRLDFAVALVKAAGLDSEAQQRVGAPLGVEDEESVPVELRGYASVAMERKLISPVPSQGFLLFNPGGSVPRIDAALYLLNLFDLRSGSPISSLMEPIRPSGSGGSSPAGPANSPGNTGKGSIRQQ